MPSSNYKRQFEEDEDRIREGSESFSDISILGNFDRSVLYQPQGPDTGINAIIGKWPGDESDEVIQALLDEMS